VPADRGALGRYVDGLIGALDVAGADLAVVCQRADEERYGRLAPSARVVTGPTALSHRAARLAWEQSGLPVVAQQVNADVIHVPYYSMPLRPGRPTVVTVHDVTFFTEPELYSPVSAMFFKSAIRTAARRAARLIVPSKATRDELERVLAADPTKIDVAYHGVDHRLFHRPDPQQVSQVSNRLGLHGKPYIAFLGMLEPRKNVAALITGWAAAVADLDEPPALVLGGALDFVTILVELAQIHTALLFLLAPRDPAPTSEASAEHQRTEPGQAHHREEARLQRSDARGVHHDQGADDPHQQRRQRDHQQDVAWLALRQRQWRRDRNPHRWHRRRRFTGSANESEFGHA